MLGACEKIIMKQKKIVTILLLLAMFLLIAGCGKVSANRGVTYDAELESEMEAETENETNIKEESAAEVNEESGIESTNDTEQLYEEYSYYVRKKQLYSWASSMFLDIERPEGIEYAPVILVEIPDNSEKEERINEIIVRQCARTLPMDQEWLYSVEIQITYRSEKYLCYEYVSHTALPEGYDATQLYVTIDIEEERWIEYPPGEWWCKNGLSGMVDGDVKDEKEEYIKKTVEEQSRLKGGTTYELYQAEWECEGITFPCAQIKGMADRAKQDKINQALREPLTVLAQADWDDEIRYKENLKETDIYVAYKSEQWLSIVYLYVAVETSPGDGEWKYRGDGIVDFGVTVDMRTGERCMLDDLFEKQGLLEWLNSNIGSKWELLWQLQLSRSILPEEKFIEDGYEKGYSAYHVVLDFCQQDTFYLYPGRLVLSNSWDDLGVPLQDISQYLKVDPWYD